MRIIPSPIRIFLAVELVPSSGRVKCFEKLKLVSALLPACRIIRSQKCSPQHSSLPACSSLQLHFHIQTLFIRQITMLTYLLLKLVGAMDDFLIHQKVLHNTFPLCAGVVDGHWWVGIKAEVLVQGLANGCK